MLHLLVSTTLFYPSTLGGPANALYWLAKGLAKKGADVTVVTTNSHIDGKEIEPDKWLDIDGIKIRYCQCGFGHIMRMIWHTCRVIKRMDWVMLCDMFQRQVFITATISRICKKRIIWSPRGELSQAALRGRLTKRIYLWLVRVFFAHSVTFHATSEEEKRLIHSHFGENADVIVIPNYMELPSLHRHHDDTPPFFLYLGRIAPIKALDRLIDGLAESKLFYDSDFVFKLAGGVEAQFEEYKKQLVDKIYSYNLENKISFIGPVHGEQKAIVLADSYVLMLVSYSENFGNVVIEALSQGTPVVASKGTPWEGLTLNKAGEWIDNTPEEIAHCVDKMISLTTEEYRHFRINALNYGRSFDIHNNVSIWFNALGSRCR